MDSNSVLEIFRSAGEEQLASRIESSDVENVIGIVDHAPMIDHPISVYDVWAAYDELTDQIELTEELAMRQFANMIRLKKAGARFDYYMMDAFWYSRDGAYRSWRQPHWPDGPDRWFKACREHDIKPGLWFTTNVIWPLYQIDPAPEWLDSLSADRGTLCMFQGGFLAHFLETLSIWYERGVRLFKFDFVDLGSATPELARTMLPSEIRAANIRALHEGLAKFRKAHPEAVFMAFNGFEEAPTQENTSFPFRRTVSDRWLEVFDSLYCGDARPADVPAMNFWRSKDIYSDHMVRVYERNGIPLSRIDNCAFMVGGTGTCYRRKIDAWKGMLILSLARGGWVNNHYGDIGLFSDADAQWFGKVHEMFFPLQAKSLTKTFGGVPGNSEPYGYTLLEAGDGVIVVVNPSQRELVVDLPVSGPNCLLFRDAGFDPILTDEVVVLGPEQLCLIGIGSFACAESDLGVQADVIIPVSIHQLEVCFEKVGNSSIHTSIRPSAVGKLRIVLRQIGPNGQAVRSTAGGLVNSVNLGEILRISVRQGDREIPITINYDKSIWSGLSWAVGEVATAEFTSDTPVLIQCKTSETRDVTLSGEVYLVEYSV